MEYITQKLREGMVDIDSVAYTDPFNLGYNAALNWAITIVAEFGGDKSCIRCGAVVLPDGSCSNCSEGG